MSRFRLQSLHTHFGLLVASYTRYQEGCDCIRADSGDWATIFDGGHDVQQPYVVIGLFAQNSSPGKSGIIVLISRPAVTLAGVDQPEQCTFLHYRGPIHDLKRSGLELVESATDPNSTDWLTVDESRVPKQVRIYLRRAVCDTRRSFGQGKDWFQV